MIPENTDTPLKADCSSAPCSASFIAWVKSRGVWPRLTHEEIWNAAWTARITKAISQPTKMKTTSETEIERLIIKQSPRMCGCGYESDIVFAYHAERIAAERDAAIAERDEARREAERWRDCFQTGMSLQPKAPSQIFPWENNQND